MAVPRDIQDAVESVTGERPGRVTVRRGPSIDQMASQISADSYATEGIVHLPGSAPLTSDRSRILLAHELTHVVQQQSGSAPRHENSPAGVLAERQALATESALAGRAPMPSRAVTPGTEPTAPSRTVSSDAPLPTTPSAVSASAARAMPSRSGMGGSTSATAPLASLASPMGTAITPTVGTSMGSPQPRPVVARGAVVPSSAAATSLPRTVVSRPAPSRSASASGSGSGGGRPPSDRSEALAPSPESPGNGPFTGTSVAVASTLAATRASAGADGASGGDGAGVQRRSTGTPTPPPPPPGSNQGPASESAAPPASGGTPAPSNGSGSASPGGSSAPADTATDDLWLERHARALYPHLRHLLRSEFFRDRERRGRLMRED